MSAGRLIIISGGQTGADRAALDAALDAGAPCGGWCPEGRRAEDGPIDPRYPLTELSGAGYRRRTRRNVIDSDATVILSSLPLTGGTAQAHGDCVAHRRPCLVIDTAADEPAAAAVKIDALIRDHRVARLNVAGPRASGQPGVYDYTYQVIARVIERYRNRSG